MSVFIVTVPESSSQDLYGNEVTHCNQCGEPMVNGNPAVFDDIIFRSDNITSEELKKELVEHDGYNPSIEVEEEEEV